MRSRRHDVGLLCTVFRFAGKIQLTGVLGCCYFFVPALCMYGVLDHGIPEIAATVELSLGSAHADIDGAICHRE